MQTGIKKTGSKISAVLKNRAYGFAALIVLIGLWQAGILLFDPPHFILPSPLAVGSAIFSNFGYLANHAAITFNEMVVGFIFGSIAGVVVALLLARSKLLERMLMPVVVTSQTLPVFAIAPILVIWFGFGMGSKIVMAGLIIFFPVASAFHDGLKSVPFEWQDLGRSWGASQRQQLIHINVPAALPHLGAGLKIAATIAPIGAIVGEWAGASGGLGFIMLQANARMQTDLVFASLIILAIMAWMLRAIISLAIDHFIFWRR